MRDRKIDVYIGDHRVTVHTVDKLADLVDTLRDIQHEATVPLQHRIEHLEQFEVRENERLAAGLYGGTGQAEAENAGAIAGRDEALRKLAAAKDTIAALEEQVKRLTARRSRADRKKRRR